MSGRNQNRTKAATLLAAFLLVSCPAMARNQWDINHGGNNPPIDPNFMPGGKHSGYVPKFTPDFWQGMTSNKIPTGTVLSAILEDDISSKSNKPGDTFVLTIQDGFQLNGRYLIPSHAKIIGTINSVTPAKMQRTGMPGQIEISLQSLVFPDGRHLPICAFIDSNPNFMPKSAAKLRHAGHSLADYGESLVGMAFSFVSGPGFMMKRLHGGNDFKMEKGEVVAVRLTRSLNLPSDNTTQPAIKPPPAAPGAAPGPRVPGIIDPEGPVSVPGLVDPEPAPSLPAAQPASARLAPPPAPPIAAAPTAAVQSQPQSQGNPNAVFDQLLESNPAPSLKGLPDPF